MGIRLFAVGGFVRDLLLDRPVTDVDLAVEGDALALARTMVERQGGRLTVHDQFQTASIEGVVSGRVDLALTRKEEYPHAGALPVVNWARIEEDLIRRDFSVNAMAIALNPGSFGLLMDPLGGWRDLTHRVIRVLHPLGFIEDPTRIFRAIRYAVRLGFGIEQATLRLLRSALGVSHYPELSGQRLLAELTLAMREPEPATIFIRLGRVGAFRLILPGYRFASQTAERFQQIQRSMIWSNKAGFSVDFIELMLAALIENLTEERAGQLLERLSIRGERRERLLRLRREPEAGLSADSPSQLVRLLKPLHPTALGWLWVRGTPSVKRKVEWFITEGRAIHPLMTGDDLLTLGVPVGPRVGEYLWRLRAARADGAVATREEEEKLVKAWLKA
jgi:tRNA nucleotidyltransferase (CCA-adding enzyme)